MLNRSTIAVAATFALVLSVGCTSVRSISYGDGWVRTSNVSYQFVGPPVLRDASGSTYSVEVTGFDAPAAISIAPFDRHGMRGASTGRGDVRVEIELGEVRQEEPGAMKLGAKWYPAFEVSVPYEVGVRRGAESLAERSGVYTNVLTFNQMPGFPSREEAVGALDAIRRLAQKRIDEEERAKAFVQAKKRAGEAASRLFQERNISLEVPVVRSAAGLDLEGVYALVASARSPEQVRTALTEYESIGMEHAKADGTPNQTANYGVACGIAACRLLLRDLAGAWSACVRASEFEPRGEEADTIRSVIYRQEMITGVRVIPDEDRARIEAAERAASALEGMFRAF